MPDGPDITTGRNDRTKRGSVEGRVLVGTVLVELCLIVSSYVPALATDIAPSIYTNGFWEVK